MDQTLIDRMPQYKCHKIVRALKIKTVEIEQDRSRGVIAFEEDGFPEFSMDASFLRKHDPEAGSYFMVYADGYMSISPAKAFEEGYTEYYG